MKRALLVPLSVLALLTGCGSSPCTRVCHKLATCNALQTTEQQCTQDCEQPTNGHTCSNEDAIATCIEGVSCDVLASESTRVRCPLCN